MLPRFVSPYSRQVVSCRTMTSFTSISRSIVNKTIKLFPFLLTLTQSDPLISKRPECQFYRYKSSLFQISENKVQLYSMMIKESTLYKEGIISLKKEFAILNATGKELILILRMHWSLL